MIKQTVFFLLTVFLLSACNQSSTNDSAESIVKPEYKTASKYPGKPHAPVSMKYTFKSVAQLDQPLQISLTFSVEQATSLLEMAYTTDPGLVSADAAQQVQLGALLPGSEKTLLISVIPRQSGLNHIHVFATLNTDDGHRQSRSFAISVNIVADSKQLLKATQNKPDNGTRHLPDQNVISMPAAEPAK